MRTSTFLSQVSLLAASCYGLYTYYLQKGTDLENFAYGTFIVIFIHMLTFSKLFDDDLIRISYTFVRTIALPFYTTDILLKYGTIPQANYAPAAFGGILAFVYIFLENPSESFVELSTYGSCLILVYIGHTNHKIFIAIAGLFFVLGEYILSHAKTYFDQPPTTLYNFCLAAFTASACRGLTA